MAIKAYWKAWSQLDFIIIGIFGILLWIVVDHQRLQDHTGAGRNIINDFVALGIFLCMTLGELRKKLLYPPGTVNLVTNRSPDLVMITAGWITIFVVVPIAFVGFFSNVMLLFVAAAITGSCVALIFLLADSIMWIQQQWQAASQRIP